MFRFTLKSCLIFLLLFYGRQVFSSPDSAWKKTTITADSLRLCGKYEEAIPLYQHSLAVIPATNTAYLQYTLRLGISAFMAGKDSLAQKSYTRVIQLTEQAPTTLYRAHAYNNLGLLHDNAGNYNQSIRNYQNAARIYLELNENFFADLVEMNIGIVYKKQGRYLKALKRLTNVAVSFEQRGDSLQLGETYSTLGAIQEILGNLTGAQNYFRHSLMLRIALKDSYGMASTYNNLGGIFKAQQQYDSALTCYNEAAQLMHVSGTRNLGQVYHNLGDCYRQLNNPEKANHYFQKALTHKLNLADSSEIVFTAHALAAIELEKASLLTAAHFLQLAQNHIIPNDGPDNWYRHFTLKKNYFKLTKETDSALFYLEKATQLQREINNATYLKATATLYTAFERDQQNKAILRLEDKTHLQEATLEEKSVEINNLESYLFSFFWLVVIGFIFFVLIIVLLRQRTARAKLLARLDGVEEEKQRLSMELHEAAGSEIRNVKFNMQQLVQQYPNDQIVKKIRPILSNLEYASNEIVMVSHALYHPQLETETFSVLLTDFIYDWFENSNIQFNCNTDQLFLLDELKTTSKSHIYRSLQEIFINIKRHAHATTVNLHVETKQEWIHLTVTDDGIGTIPTDKRGIGHTNLKRRAQLLKGSFEIYPNRSNQGTVNQLRFPKKENLYYDSD